MRRSFLSNEHVLLSRNISLSVALLVFAVVLINIANASGIGLAPWIAIWICSACGISAWILLFWGYEQLKVNITQSEVRNRAEIATANRDSLTGALTRAHFLRALKEVIFLGAKTPVAYIQLDMDHLKLINDGSGHGAGDAALCALVSRLRAALPDAIIGRMGGDEFGIAVLGHDNTAAISKVCYQILDDLARPILVDGRHIKLGATMGFALFPKDGMTTDEVISKADLALYKGKNQGRGLVVAFDDTLHADERHRRFVERELRAAILLNQLELHYQPIFSADGKTLRSYESLVRWNHPVRGLIPPFEFIHIAEMSDLIDKLGDWVLKRACSDIDVLEAPSIGVNVSAAQLKRTDFSERFKSILHETGVSGDRIVVEITETVPLMSGGAELKNLDALRALDIRIAIDDFGAGNASLDYIKRFSFDVLKIDRSYVESVTSNRIDAMTVGAISRIARAAGMLVVAEGIETEEQCVLLQNLGCTALQGYLLGRPQSLHWHLSQRAKKTSISAAA